MPDTLAADADTFTSHYAEPEPEYEEQEKTVYSDDVCIGDIVNGKVMNRAVFGRTYVTFFDKDEKQIYREPYGRVMVIRRVQTEESRKAADRHRHNQALERLVYEVTNNGVHSLEWVMNQFATRVAESARSVHLSTSHIARLVQDNASSRVMLEFTARFSGGFTIGHGYSDHVEHLNAYVKTMISSIEYENRYNRGEAQTGGMFNALLHDCYIQAQQAFIDNARQMYGCTV